MHHVFAARACGVEEASRRGCLISRSAIGYRLSAIGYRLSAIGYRLSAIGYRLSAIETLAELARVEHAAWMTTGTPALVYVVIAGPQASGKSALTVALSRELRAQGEQVAAVELDQIASMALPTLPEWEVAHQITETVAGLWLRAGMSCVIVEGAGTSGEVRRLLRQTPDGVPALTIATTAPSDVAFERALADRAVDCRVRRSTCERSTTVGRMSCRGSKLT